jgi:hypothetical protein
LKKIIGIGPKKNIVKQSCLVMLSTNCKGVFKNSILFNLLQAHEGEFMPGLDIFKMAMLNKDMQKLVLEIPRLQPMSQHLG